MQGKKTVLKSLLDRSLRKKNYLRMERKKIIGGHIVLTLILGWQFGIWECLV